MKIKNLAALLFSIFAVACDTGHRDRLLKESDDLSRQMSLISSYLLDIDAELKRLKDENEKLTENENTLLSYNKEILVKQTEYIAQHKMATLQAATVIAGTSVALEDNSNKIAATGAAIASVFCMMNADECSEAAIQLSYWSSELKTNDDKLVSISEMLYENREHTEVLKLNASKSVEEKISISHKLNAINRRLDQLSCKYFGRCD